MGQSLHVISLGIGLGIGLLALPAPAQNNYRVADLDGNGVLSLAAAFRMSESGTAVGLGNPTAAPDTRGVTWTNRISTLLPPLPGHEISEAYDVSETGIAGGTSFDVTQVGQLTIAVPHAVIWQNGIPVELSTLVTGGANLELHGARRLNERGQILGEGRDAAIRALRAFVLQSGVVTDLGALSPTDSTEPFDMNELGHVVGSSDATLGIEHAFVWSNGVMTDLHDPTVIFGRCSTARAINERGMIVGSADFVANGLQFETATVWDHGTITNLGTLAGNQSYARDINDHGTIVGTTTFAGNGVHAFIYRRGAMVDLNGLIPPASGWVLANAHDITQLALPHPPINGTVPSKMPMRVTRRSGGRNTVESICVGRASLSTGLAVSSATWTTRAPTVGTRGSASRASTRDRSFCIGW